MSDFYSIAFIILTFSFSMATVYIGRKFRELIDKLWANHKRKDQQ